MARSKWKLKNINTPKFNNFFNKSSIVLSSLKDQTIKVYNGKEFKTILITKEKIGYKIGEFVATRKPNIYKGKKKLKKNKWGKKLRL